MKKVEFYPALKEDVAYKLYVHICKEKNKYGNYGVYFGITCQGVNERWRIDGKGYKRKNKDGEYTHFYKAILKHGWDNFEHIVLLNGISLNVANKAEEYFIKLYKTDNKKYGYNSRSGGEHSKHSIETCEKIKQFNLGKKRAQWVCDKISEGIRKGGGRKGDKNPMYGKKFTKDHIDKIKNALKGKYTGSKSSCSVKVVNINTLKIHTSMREASEYENIADVNIVNHCKCRVKNPKFMYYKDLVLTIWLICDIISTGGKNVNLYPFSHT